MIYANEVRIGNVVHDCPKNVDKPLDAEDIYLITKGFGGEAEMLDSIRLDIQWMIKLGLRSNGFGSFEIDTNPHETEFFKVEINGFVVRLVWQNLNMGIVHFRKQYKNLSVHQFQNIFHSLTGKDLTIKI